MPETANKAVALTVIFLAAFIGAVSLTMFFYFLFTGSLGWIDLGMNEAGRLVFNTLLSFAFFLQHSGMVRRPFRRMLDSVIPHCYQGAIYTVISGFVLLTVVVLWQGSHVILIQLDGPISNAMRWIYFLAICGLGWGMWALHSIDMFGLGPVFKKLRAKPLHAIPLTIRGPYRWVRHPLYLFMIVLIWCSPTLTTDRLLFNVIWTIWIVVGTRLEEQDLVSDFGDTYRSYQTQVPMLVPHGIFPAYPGSKQKSVN